jgi:hypothetical protein
MKELFKNKSLACAILASALSCSTASANVYVEYEEHYEKTDWSYYYDRLCNYYDCYGGYTERFVNSERYSTSRLGYEFEAGLYFEVGEGSAGVGFKKSFSNFEIELDHERFDNTVNTMHTDVRVRYTFGN